MGVEDSGVRADRVHADVGEVFGGGDERVGQRAARDVHHEIVDGESRTPLDDVEREDVRADRAERDGERAEAAGTIGQLDSQQVRHVRPFRSFED